MDSRIEQLHDMGCNTADALERMVGDEEFYIECLQEALRNPEYDNLAKALAAKDVVAGFDCAHALKGVLGNVGLTPLYLVTAEIVEVLRVGQSSGLEEKLADLLDMRQKFAEVVA